MERKMRLILMMGLLLVCSLQLKAQIDPTLAGMIYMYTEKAKGQLKAQERAMLLQTTGHIWTREEVEATTDLQRRSGTSSAMRHKYTGSTMRSGNWPKTWAA